MNKKYIYKIKENKFKYYEFHKVSQSAHKVTQKKLLGHKEGC